MVGPSNSFFALILAILAVMASSVIGFSQPLGIIGTNNRRHQRATSTQLHASSWKLPNGLEMIVQPFLLVQQRKKNSDEIKMEKLKVQIKDAEDTLKIQIKEAEVTLKIQIKDVEDPLKIQIKDVDKQLDEAHKNHNENNESDQFIIISLLEAKKERLEDKLKAEKGRLEDKLKAEKGRLEDKLEAEKKRLEDKLEVEKKRLEDKKERLEDKQDLLQMLGGLNEKIEGFQEKQTVVNSEVNKTFEEKKNLQQILESYLPRIFEIVTFYLPIVIIFGMLYYFFKDVFPISDVGKALVTLGEAVMKTTPPKTIQQPIVPP